MRERSRATPIDPKEPGQDKCMCERNKKRDELSSDTLAVSLRNLLLVFFIISTISFDVCFQTKVFDGVHLRVAAIMRYQKNAVL